MQESICADAASFDLLPNNLSSCIAEAQECIQLCSAKRTFENSADKQFDPENYAILKGEPYFFLQQQIIPVSIFLVRKCLPMLMIRTVRFRTVID